MNTNWIKNNAPTLLTLASSVGTVVTAGLGIKAGLKIADIYDQSAQRVMDYPETEAKFTKTEKKEIFKACVPVMVSGALSIGAGTYADILHRDQKSDLLAMCAVIGSSYSGYRQEVIKRYGTEVDREITDTVARHAECMYMAPDVPDKLCHWIIDMCMDDLNKYEIEAYERDILHAEMHLNRNYILSGDQSVRDFLDFLEIKDPNDPHVDNDDIYGWAINDSEIYYIDFQHIKIDDNTFRLVPVFAPWYMYDHLDMYGNEY